jgi:hypothetical protein
MNNSLRNIVSKGVAMFLLAMSMLFIWIIIVDPVAATFNERGRAIDVLEQKPSRQEVLVS